MKTPEQTSAEPSREPIGSARSGLEPIGDPDVETPDFAGEHEQFVVEKADDKDSSYAGGLDEDGPP